ncbi:MAG: indolepyruvate ferredoxin oxidoreductase subunit alpha [Clostridia bacterium]|nr:indolepyruvate ferredoxin oxidoreductase subunit alpha [Clostridia bacterium]
MKELMLGNAAVARGAYEAGVRFVSSYPGTPSTEITEFMAKYPESDVYCEWAPNEKVSAEAAVGASIAGARAMTCCKHVGLNVMADPFFTASYTGVRGGLVICVADDPGMHSSQNEQDSRHYARASKIPMLEPSDSEECLQFTKLAFELSERFDTPVFLRLTTRVAHSQSLVTVGERQGVPLLPYEKDPRKYVMMPGNAIVRHPVVEARTKAVSEASRTLACNRVENHGMPTGVVCSGINYLYAKEAFGDRVNYLKLGLVWPVDGESIRAFADACEKVYVLEELDPFLEDICTSFGVDVIGKEAFPLEGEYSSSLVRSVVFHEQIPFASPKETVPPRPPAMCPGCPHRGVFYVLSKMKLIVSGDIGCYTLGALKPLSALDSTICMGASVSAAHGMAKVRGDEWKGKLVSVIGDSTFMHSGMTALSDVVYNQGSNTVIILDNSITGMTGHQDNPLTGKTIRGAATRQADLITICRGLGVDRISVIDPFDLNALENALKTELASDEPSVIIAQRPCALLKSVHYSGRCVVTEDCIKCRRCMKLGCPAISLRGQRADIDATLCVGCGLCVQVCPRGAIQTEEKQ